MMKTFLGLAAAGLTALTLGAGLGPSSQLHAHETNAKGALNFDAAARCTAFYFSFSEFSESESGKKKGIDLGEKWTRVAMALAIVEGRISADWVEKTTAAFLDEKTALAEQGGDLTQSFMDDNTVCSGLQVANQSIFNAADTHLE
ncbi:MAG: hypothetical protein ABJK59_00320 [Erythrobacter sp.]|uniref:hypothetical protein n=1 Tax=Erythrobacter sp. TaxID=1042 RepID=UPI003296F77F